MPAFSADQISDEVITDIHAYLTSLEAPADFSPAQADLPADAPAGQTLLAQKRCVACHGTTGPIQGFQARGQVPTAELVIAQLRTPRQNMPSFGVEQVSDAEAGQIAEFLAVQISTPESLPTSGGGPSLVLPATLLVLSAVLLLGGLLLRYSSARA
jgi:mono/diheme cytochrome c family protein